MSERKSQCDLVLNALKGGPKTIWQLTEGLRISRPGARIWDLKQEGHAITDEWKEVQGRRVKVYTLEGHSSSLPTVGPQNERVNGHDERVGECSNCHSHVYRKPKARRPLPGERLFCEQACHDAYWNGQKRQAELFTDSQQIYTAFQSRGDGTGL